MNKKITPKTLKSGQYADAIIFDHRSPTGAWYAEMTSVTPDTEQAMPLSDQDGDYIPAKNYKLQMETTKTLDQAIAECAAHWAAVWDTTPEWIIHKAQTHQTVAPEHGWRRSRFSDWGNAQKVSHGIKALGKAIDGKASYQWKAVWMR